MSEIDLGIYILAVRWKDHFRGAQGRKTRGEQGKKQAIIAQESY